MEYLLYLTAVVLGLISRYLGGLTSATLYIGKSISNIDSPTGYQDAITPPKSTTITFIIWAGIALTIGYSIYEYGWARGGIILLLYFVASTLAGVLLIPKADSEHFLKLIYNSIVNRFADYSKAGDRLRADAMEQLIGKVETKFLDKLR